MELNKEYKQIFLHCDSDYNLLKNKVVDKIAFTNIGEYDTHMCIITFTDKTFIALGVGYNDLENYENEPKLSNELIIEPQNWNSGNFRLYMHVDSNNKIMYSPYIRILRDLNIWQFTDEEELAIIEKSKKDRDDHEYKEYLRLKEKFENKDSNSNSWWDKCKKCKNFEGYDMCLAKGNFGAVTDMSKQVCKENNLFIEKDEN